MLLIIVLVGFAFALILTFVLTREGAAVSGVAVVAGVVGFFVMVIGNSASIGKDPEAGWSVVGETTYTLAEGSEIEMVGTRIDIVAEIDGSLKPVTLEGVRKIDFPGESTRTAVVVQEEFRELGTGVWWWGEGQARTVVSVR